MRNRWGTYLQHNKHNMSLIDILISKFAPHDCLGCGQEGALLCCICAAKLTPVENHAPKKVGRITAATTYNSIAKKLVWQLKFQGAQAAAADMSMRMAALLQTDEHDLIVPVPTATKRVRQRGYDQAKLLARHMARQKQLPYMDCLRRSGQTHQVGASREQRLMQLRNAFQLKSGYMLGGNRIVIVDDVVTTGATLEAAASILLASGASQVDAIVFACA